MKRLVILASLLTLSSVAFANPSSTENTLQSNSTFGVTDGQQSVFVTPDSMDATASHSASAHIGVYRIQLKQGKQTLSDSTMSVSDGETGVFSVTKTTSYIKSVSRTTEADGQEKLVTTPGKIEYGFTFKLHQFADNTLRFQAKVGDLAALRRQQIDPKDTSKNAPFIELPDLRVNEMLNSFQLEEGQSIDLTGVQTTDGTHAIPELHVIITHLKDNQSPASLAAL